MICVRLLLTALLLALLPTAPAAAGDAVWPLVPRPAVVRAFNPPASPWGAGHRGVDLLGHAGQTVRAARAGTITFAGTLAGRGVVVVSHGATRTTYEPVRASVHVGDRVGTGSAIGTLQIGRSHCFPRACLHWGLLRGSTYLNPLTLVGGGPVRLLPPSGLVPAPAATVPGGFIGPVQPPTYVVGSGAGMGQSVGGLEPLGRDVGVDLGGGQ